MFQRKFLVGLVVFLFGCEKEPIPQPFPCTDGTCGTYFYIDPISNPGAKLHPDGYWRVKYNDLNYFTIRGEISTLDPHYVINGIPLVETKYDSDYWIVFDTLKFKIPTYSYMSWFTNDKLNKPLPVGNKTYTVTNLSRMTDLYNLAGYQITKKMCLDCPYTPTLLGTYSKYNYYPTQNIFFDKSMAGDTASIFIQVTFNSDMGRSEIREKEMKIIFE